MKKQKHENNDDDLRPYPDSDFDNERTPDIYHRCNAGGCDKLADVRMIVGNKQILRCALHYCLDAARSKRNASRLIYDEAERLFREPNRQEAKLREVAERRLMKNWEKQTSPWEQA